MMESFSTSPCLISHVGVTADSDWLPEPARRLDTLDVCELRGGFVSKLLRLMFVFI